MPHIHDWCLGLIENSVSTFSIAFTSRRMLYGDFTSYLSQNIFPRFINFLSHLQSFDLTWKALWKNKFYQCCQIQKFWNDQKIFCYSWYNLSITFTRDVAFHPQLEGFTKVTFMKAIFIPFSHIFSTCNCKYLSLSGLYTY